MAQPWGHEFWFEAAIGVLGVHLLFNCWFVFGAGLTKGRPTWEILHVLTLVYGVIAENVRFTCPLTLMEKWCESRAGMIPYDGTFELHYWRAVVSPHFPAWLLSSGAVGVMLLNLAIYARRNAPRYAQRHRAAH